MSEPVAIPTPKRRPWRFWRWVKRTALALLLLIAVALLVGFGEMKWTRRAGQKKLDAATAKLDAEDPGWRFEDIVAEHNSKVPPDEVNSALRAVEIVGRFPKSADPERSPWAIQTRMQAGRLPNELPDEEAWEDLESQYSAWAGGIAELRKWNAATPRGRFKIDYAGGSPLDVRYESSHQVRTAVAALAWDALRSAHAGRGDRALASALAGLHLARSVDFAPILITYLARTGASGIALKSLEQSLSLGANAGDAALAEAQETVWRESSSATVRPALRGERAFMHKAIVMADRGEIDLLDAPLSRGSLREQVMPRYYMQFLPNSASYVLDRFDELLPMADLLPSEKRAALKKWELPVAGREYIFGRMLMRPVQAVMQLGDVRYQTKCICTAAGIACERYRLKHGKWPAALDDLAEFGLAKGLIDPFDGQPLRYRIVEDGAIVYSVGTNGIDDGGDVVRREGTPDDVGFRLWNPDKRKVPMPEKPKPDE